MRGYGKDSPRNLLEPSPSNAKLVARKPQRGVPVLRKRVGDGMINEQINWLDRDEEYGEDDANESSSDLSLSADKFSGLIIAPADWTIATLYSQIGRQIDLNPDFQRRNVWSPKAKSRFIESLLLGIPIPQILLSSKSNSKNSFIVLDGKQRLLTIKEFLDGRHPNGSIFRLKDLRILKDLDDKSWEDLKDDEEWAPRLLNETQRTAVLKGWTDESTLYEIFYRLNSGSVKLSPMELRMSLHPGDFLKFILRWSEDIGPVHRMLKKRTPDLRMGDVEIAVRHLAFAESDLTYEGDLKKFLDELCAYYNRRFESSVFSSYVFEKLDEMNSAIEAGLEIFGENKFCRKYTQKGYETRFNRALFDIMSFTLANPFFRDWARENSENLMTAYQNISLEDNEFIRSIETTTKSPEATFTRFMKWLQTCQSLSGVNFVMPNIRF